MLYKYGKRTRDLGRFNFYFSLNSSHAHKTGSWYLLGILFNISDEHPRPLNLGVPPPGHRPRLFPYLFHSCAKHVEATPLEIVP